MGKEQKTVVVDTSLALKWIVYEEDSLIAQALLTEWATQNILLLAPNLLMCEITNSLYKKVRRDEITLKTARYAIETLMTINLNFQMMVDKELSLKTLNFAHTYNLPASYDAHYLALAEREGCEFWTADERLYNSVKDQLSWVRLMVDPPPASMAFCRMRLEQISAAFVLY